DRERVVKAAADGSLDLVIGTHALVQEGVTFADLSLAVIDEQHRFGLHQRTALSGKGAGDIDVLIMTATPIPRTLALTYYGDLDVPCILFDTSEATNEEARARIDAVVATTDGFALADEDLRLRGEGTLFDVRQSGLPDLKLARLAEDVELIGRARDRAFALV